MDWFLYDNGLRHERVKLMPLQNSVRTYLCKESFQVSRIFFLEEYFSENTRSLSVERIKKFRV